ncbi:MAG: hypothetical protein BM563_09135 [Bacteroidetes bacterium MedPE-SWsnd-G1]|uniref:Uncharacterized protein n=1 Tax=Urechidicola vernalis TaxID=3075600 RepID=A0ABU2Y5G3_9FLAO|nr:hypothetical protein [Urechidicola sp. P050]MDT0553005.1 hypothetical protein [Urechidicola sp. P050]OIQ37203.1 MAG: hypothetical protein BM563_09135 [Bacteroidetes bacterium MedPE-SWsnd-G1]
MNRFKNTSFLKLALRFFIVFFILVGFMRVFMGIFKFDGFQGMKTELFEDGKWMLFLQLQVGLSLVYGLFMAGYYKYIKK